MVELRTAIFGCAEFDEESGFVRLRYAFFGEFALPTEAFLRIFLKSVAVKPGLVFGFKLLIFRFKLLVFGNCVGV